MEPEKGDLPEAEPPVYGSHCRKEGESGLVARRLRFQSAAAKTFSCAVNSEVSADPHSCMGWEPRL